MGARDEAIEFMLQWENDPVWVADLVEAIENEHARKLAEKIRADIAESDLDDMFYNGMKCAADLIDPDEE